MRFQSGKEMFKEGLEHWKQERQAIFNKYGWRIEYFDETGVYEENIKKY